MTTRTLAQRIEYALQRGLEAFWEEVYKEFDEVNGRDVFDKKLEEVGYDTIENFLEENTTYLDYKKQ